MSTPHSYQIANDRSYKVYLAIDPTKKEIRLNTGRTMYDIIRSVTITPDNMDDLDLAPAWTMYIRRQWRRWKIF